MIPMGVCKNEIVAMNAFFDELVSKSSNSGTGIDNNDIATCGPNLNTGGITTIFNEFLT